MYPGFIPIRLTLAEICVAALMEAADGIEAARDEAAFMDALDGNHRLWLAVRDFGATAGWAEPSSRDAEFVISHSSGLGRGINDADVDAIIVINRHVAGKLAAGGDIPRVRARIRLAYREGGGGGFIPWMLGQIYKKGRLRSVFDPASEQGRLCPMIRAAALKFAREADRSVVKRKPRTTGVCPDRPSTAEIAPLRRA